MLSSVEQAFVGRDEKRAPLKTPAWEASVAGTGVLGDEAKAVNFEDAHAHEGRNEEELFPSRSL